MKIKTPKGMSEKEVIECIMSVCKHLSQKYKFGYFDAKDIEQEGFIIGVEGLYSYDESIPLRNFLYIHISNRLKNLKRDFHYRQPVLCKDCQDSEELCEKCTKRIETANIRQNIMSPIDIQSIKIDTETNTQYKYDYEQMLDDKIVLELIDKNIPHDMRQDYLKYKDGASLPTFKKQKLFEFIDNLLIENGYKE